MTVWSLLTQVRVRQKPDNPYLKSERRCRFDIRNQSNCNGITRKPYRRIKTLARAIFTRLATFVRGDLVLNFKCLSCTINMIKLASNYHRHMDATFKKCTYQQHVAISPPVIRKWVRKTDITTTTAWEPLWSYLKQGRQITVKSNNKKHNKVVFQGNNFNSHILKDADLQNTYVAQ